MTVLQESGILVAGFSMMLEGTNEELTGEL
jgi:hypothetical protein